MSNQSNHNSLHLPSQLILDNILPLLSNSDLAALRRVSKPTKSLVDEDLVWKRKTIQEFSFPVHASARVGRWKNLYQGLSRPQVWVWGDAGRGRLGGADGLHSFMHRLTRSVSGIPFPVKNDIVQNVVNPNNPPQTSHSLKPNQLGVLVEIVAGGWSFHGRTSTGKVIYWGTLNGENMGSGLRNPHCSVETPSVLALPSHTQVVSISCGRSHAVALTSDGNILEWRAWANIFKHETLVPRPTLGATIKVEQLVAGWSFSAILVSNSTIAQNDCEYGNPENTETDVYFWKNDWSEQSYRRTHFQNRLEQYSSYGDPQCQEADGLIRLQVQPVKLPPHPCKETHSRFVRIAGGENFIIALDQDGKVFLLDLQNVSHEGFDQDEAQRDLLEQECARGKREWTLLSSFCDAAQIRNLPHLSDLPELESSDFKISHISAHFRHFVAYTQSFKTENGYRSGIVLIGEQGSKEPQVIPELQNAGVIKVVMGDYHFGALTEDGKVLTWGSWSNGALGQWFDLPVAPPHVPHQPRMGLFRLGLVNRHAVRLPYVDHTSPDYVDDPSDPFAVRQMPESIPTAKPVQFYDLDKKHPTETFAFDIAFAGWHSSALVLDQAQDE